MIEFTLRGSDMAHGRNTTVVAIRISDSVYTMLQKRAIRKGLSVGDYVRWDITCGWRSCFAVLAARLPRKTFHRARFGGQV